jgi:hypothetical protein
MVWLWALVVKRGSMVQRGPMVKIREPALAQELVVRRSSSLRKKAELGEIRNPHNAEMKTGTSYNVWN